jgi:hypothetical protein
MMQRTPALEAGAVDPSPLLEETSFARSSGAAVVFVGVGLRVGVDVGCHGEEF